MSQAKKWMSICLISFIALGAFNIATAKPKDVQPAQVAERMQKELGLTDLQKEQVELIMTEQRAKAESIMSELKAVHEETKAKLEEVLTPEQLEKLEGMKAERRDKMKGKRQGKTDDKPEVEAAE